MTFTPTKRWRTLGAIAMTLVILTTMGCSKTADEDVSLTPPSFTAKTLELCKPGTQTDCRSTTLQDIFCPAGGCNPTFVLTCDACPEPFHYWTQEFDKAIDESNAIESGSVDVVDGHGQKSITLDGAKYQTSQYLLVVYAKDADMSMSTVTMAPSS